ncbi:D-2-hydroxyacid dehydrogenase [Paludibacterium purpuratum]|uniref:Glycerate dehydrogenase n=1 Tax=Paludibacterium purpuratum TaxID=1144873 RepID=A0A4R7AX00_9NEIS|nr:D-2-hydroxyacid dehydrogenase [Paludibacterium purpuratum]TDR70731.1 glycerate dehydrogenase [Paludibacterium purpuratum]
MTTRMVFLDRNSLPVPLPDFPFPHQLIDYEETAPEALLSRCIDAEVLIVNKVRLGRELLQQLPRLKLIAVAATGVNNVDLGACHDLGISVCNVRHYGDETVAEHAFMLLLALFRNLPHYLQSVRNGEWSQSRQFCLYDAPLRDLAGSCLVIVGSGGIGQALATRARAFGMNVQFAERRGRGTPRAGFCTFEEGLSRADALSLHCMLTPETRGLIGAAEFAAMKPGAILINTARGELVDEPALLAALCSGRLGGAGLDVLSQEPPIPDAELPVCQLSNLIVTPHVAWASQQAMTRLARQVVDNVAAFLAGEPRNLVV